MPARGVLLFLALLLLALLIRIGVVSFYAIDTELPVARIVTGHDGAEYMKFARHLAGGSIREIPPDARRHDPGLALYLAPFTRLPHPELFAWAACMFALATALYLFWYIVIKVVRSSLPQAAVLTAAFAFAYPTQLYYSCFILTESLFTAFVLGSVLAFASGRTWSSYFLAGCAALVRGPGILLLPALLVAQVLAGKRISFRQFVPVIAGGIPAGLWILLARTSWGESHVGLLQPRLGLPFSGFAGMREVGTVRAVYVILATGFFLLSTALLLRQAALAGWNSLLLNATAVFSAVFLLFHLCIRSLYYIDRTVYTFTYQDRYMVPLLPLVLLAWRRALPAWFVAAAGALSIFLAAWWGHNYFVARGQLTPP